MEELGPPAACPLVAARPGAVPLAGRWRFWTPFSPFPFFLRFFLFFSELLDDEEEDELEVDELDEEELELVELEFLVWLGKLSGRGKLNSSRTVLSKDSLPLTV